MLQTIETERRVIYRAHSKQADFHAAPEMYKLYGGAMGGGKTWALCAEAIALSCDYPGNRGYLCRHTLKAFKKTTFLVLDKMLQDSGLIVKHHQTDNVYTLPGGSTIYYGGLGDDVSAIEKLKSMELGWFAIDEASETTESFFLMLASRLRLQLPGIQYFGLLGSNPAPGWLKHRFIDQKRPNHIFIPALPRDNPDLPLDYIRRLEEVFPPEWQQRFIQGDWTAFEGMNNIFPYQAIQAAIVHELHPSTPIELGVDVARYGDDETVLGLRLGGVAKLLQITRKQDLMSTTGLVVQAYRDHSPSHVKVDADGLGAGVVDRLREQDIDVVEIHGGGKARDPERFKNLKAEIYWGFRERLVAGNISLPDDLELQAQLTSCEYRVNSAGQIEIVSKDEMKKRGLKSPDRAEALIYAFAEAGGSDIGFEAH